MADDSLQSTATLIRRLKSGDQAAREQLVDRCLPLLRRWARGRLPQWARDAADTDDLVQVTLMRALDRIGSFEHRGQGAFLAYLRQILVNASRNELRAASRRPLREEFDHAVRDRRRSPLERAVDHQTREAYESALQSLDETQRTAVILRLEFGMSFAEVALELGSPSTDAARMMVSRSLTRMARAMAALEQRI